MVQAGEDKRLDERLLHLAREEGTNPPNVIESTVMGIVWGHT